MRIPDYPSNREADEGTKTTAERREGVPEEEAKSVLSETEIEILIGVGDGNISATAWGCDLCQTSCPHNRKPNLTPVQFFYRDRIPHLTVEALDNMTKEEFSSRAFAWRKMATIRRNLLILEDK